MWSTKWGKRMRATSDFRMISWALRCSITTMDISSS